MSTPLDQFRGLCTGCDRPICEAHATIAEHSACEAAQQAAVRAALDAADAAEPKRDRRFTRHAPLRKGEAERAAQARRRAVAHWGSLLRPEEP